MKKYTLITILIAISCSSMAQPSWVWGKVGETDEELLPAKIARDVQGNVYIAGTVSGTISSFDTCEIHSNSPNSRNFFIVKYRSNGDARWVRLATSYGDITSTGIATDPLGNVYVSGYYGSAPMYIGNDTLPYLGYYCGFVAKYDSTGNFKWAFPLNSNPGNAYYNFCTGVAADASGNCYFTGTFDGPHLTLDTITLNNPSAQEHMYFGKVNANGNVYWLKDAGGVSFGTGSVRPTVLTKDVNGNFYVSGTLSGTNVKFGNLSVPTVGTQTNVFVVKYTSSGALSWIETAAGTGYASVMSITTDASGNVIIGGINGMPTLTFGSTVLTNANSPDRDLFVAKYLSNGTFSWVSSAYGDGEELPKGLACSTDGTIYMTGTYDGDSIAFGSHSLQNGYSGSEEFMITGISSTGNVLWLESKTSGNGPCKGNDLCYDPAGYLYVTGEYHYVEHFGSVVLPYATTLLNQTFLLKAGILTGIFDPAKKNQYVAVYPNPGNGEFRINTDQEILSLKVMDITGAIILETTNTNRFTMHESGMYFVQITTKSGTAVGKVVVE